MKHTLSILLFCCFFLPLNAQETLDSLSYYTQNFQFKKALQFIDNQEETKQNKFQKAMCYKALGENKIAIRILEELSEEFPEDIKLKTELANSYERTSRWKDTSAAYANLMAIDTTNLHFAIKKSEAEINRKNYRVAIDNLEAMLQTDTLLNAVKLLGKSYETINNLDSAIYYYNMAWSADSLDSFSASNLVNVLLKNKKYGEALNYSRIFLELVPSDKNLNMLHGYSYYAFEDYDNAAAILEACYLAGDSSLIVNRSLGMSFYYRGDSECTYEYLSKAFKQDTTNSTVLYSLAVAAGETDRMDEAIEYHSKMLDRLIPKNIQLYLNFRGLAMAQEKKEEYLEAIENYGNAMRYATQNQSMDLVYAMAQVYDVKMPDNLYNKNSAMGYYRQYQGYLTSYISELKRFKEVRPLEIEQSEIDGLEAKLVSLKTELIPLQQYIKDNKPAELTDDDYLYVVNGSPVAKMPHGVVMKFSKFFDNLDEVPAEYASFVKLAKQANKKALIIYVIKKEEVKAEFAND